jgi:hypothetical protein
LRLPLAITLIPSILYHTTVGRWQKIFCKSSGPEPGNRILILVDLKTVDSVCKDALDPAPSVVLLTAPSLRSDTLAVTFDCPVKGRCAGEAQLPFTNASMTLFG